MPEVLVKFEWSYVVRRNCLWLFLNLPPFCESVYLSIRLSHLCSEYYYYYYYYYYSTSVSGLFFQDNLDKPAPQR